MIHCYLKLVNEHLKNSKSKIKRDQANWESNPSDSKLYFFIKAFDTKSTAKSGKPNKVERFINNFYDVIMEELKVNQDSIQNDLFVNYVKIIKQGDDGKVQYENFLEIEINENNNLIELIINQLKDSSIINIPTLLTVKLNRSGKKPYLIRKGFPIEFSKQFCYNQHLFELKSVICHHDYEEVKVGHCFPIIDHEDTWKILDQDQDEIRSEESLSTDNLISYYSRYFFFEKKFTYII